MKEQVQHTNFSVEKWDKNMESFHQQLQTLKSQQEQLTSAKMEKKEAAKVEEELSERIKTAKFAAEDTMRGLVSTDNYLEKYLPFKIQNMISECITFITGNEQYQKLKEFEEKLYTKLHKRVLEDDGIATLNKKAFNLPGYRMVMDYDGSQEEVKQMELYIKENISQSSKLGLRTSGP